MWRQVELRRARARFAGADKARRDLCSAIGALASAKQSLEEALAERRRAETRAETRALALTHKPLRRLHANAILSLALADQAFTDALCETRAAEEQVAAMGASLAEELCGALDGIAQSGWQPSWGSSDQWWRSPDQWWRSGNWQWWSSAPREQAPPTEQAPSQLSRLPAN